MSDLAIEETIPGFNAEQIATAAMLSSQGVSDVGVAMACGIENYEVPIIRRDPRYIEEVRELAGQEYLNDLTIDQEWNELERVAVANAKVKMEMFQEDMTPVELVRLAKDANMARRRAGTLADKRGIGNGVLPGEIEGERSKTVYQFNMPTIVVERLKKIRESGGKLIEHEEEKQDLFEKVNANEITLADVTEHLQVDVEKEEDTSVSVGAKSESGRLGNMFDKLLEESGDGIATVEG